MANHRLHNREVIPSQRKRMEEALRKGEEQYRLLTENVTDVIYTMDMDLRFTYVSPSVTRQLGYSVEEATPFSLEELLTPASFEVAMKAWAEELAIENMEQKDLNRSRVLELEMRCKDGSTVWTEMSITFLRDPDGMAVGILGVARDISERKRAEEALREAHDMLELRVEERTAELVQEIEERKRAEEALRESEEKLRVMFESTSEGIAVTDLKGKILDVNDAILRMSGLSREELVGKDGFKLMPREDTKKIIGHGTKALESGIGAEKMIQEITPTSGMAHDVGLSMGMLRDSSGDPTGFVAIVRDITESKRAEEALRESEEKYRTILEDIEDGYFEVDIAGNFTFFNDPMCEINGYSRDEMMGMNNRQYMDKENAKKVYQAFNRVYTTGKPSKEFGWEITRKDGTKRFIEASFSLIRNSEGEPIGFRGIVRDITERKEAEEERLQAMTERAAVIDAMGDGLISVNMDGKVSSMNLAFEKLCGYKEDELIGENAAGFINRFIKAEDQERLSDIFVAALKGDIPENEFFTLLNRDGREIPIFATASLMLDAEGRLNTLIVTLKDITSIKRAEEALRESEEKIRNLFESVADGIFVIDLNGAYTEGNEKLLEMMGFSSKDEILEKNAFEFIAPRDIDRAAVDMQRALEQGSVARLEYTVVRTDGSEFPAEVSAKMVKDASGNPVGFIASIRDITERKRAEEALRKSEEHYRLLAENVTDVIWTMDNNMQFTYISPSVTRQRGYSVEEAMALGMDKSLTPASLEIAAKVILEGLSEEKMGQKDLSKTWTVELEMCCKDGSTIWTEMEATFLRDPDGQTVGIQGVARDITERKQAGEALRHSEQHFRSLIENAQDGVLIVNPDITIRYQSPSMERMTGRKAKERIGKDPLEFCHPDDITGVAEAFLQLFENKIPIVHTEFRYRHKNGSWRTFEVVGNNLIDDPAVGGIVLNMRDITERKQAEEEIRRLNEELEQRVVERTVQLQAVNKELEAFAYSVSHDLRAPLRSIDGFSQVLLEDYTDRLDDEGKSYLQRVRSASQRMAELIDDLLDLSRLTRGEMRYETVDLSALAQTITMELQQSQPERDVEFTIAPGLLAKGDAHLLRVVLKNLLDNAWKFSRKQASARIEFGYAETNGQPAYFVRDNGVGFDMAYADKLFGAFQRLHSHSEFEGSGIGLATVQRIIHRHGGDIWAESAVGQGATFYFTL